MDTLLDIFFEKPRWESAIQTGVEKNIKKSVLLDLCKTETRLKLYRDIKNHSYKITPPHEARIPKENNEYRTVYVNESIDRVIFGIINDMFFELCPELIHPNCLSYQKGKSCGKAVQKAVGIVKMQKNDIIGVKIDLSKYFDSVPIEYIDKVFDYIEEKYDHSALLDLVRNYYHDSTVIDFDKNLISKYTSLRQGCAIASFLADAVLYHIDNAISQLDVGYFRYSDDILIIGNDWQKGYDMLAEMLNEMNLTLNPKKIEILSKDKWFKFLGFNIKNDNISLSESRIKTFQKEILDRTIKSKTSKNPETIIKNVHDYLYKGNGEYSWATSVLPIVNNMHDIEILNSFAMDAIRAAITGKTDIGGLGCAKENPEYNIMRGKGKNVKANKTKIPLIPDFYTLTCMKNALCTSKQAYDTLVRMI